MANFGPLAAKIDPVVWGTPANFNGFRVLAALLHGTLWRQPNVAKLSRGRHLYSAGRPSRWALAHISSSLFIGVRYAQWPIAVAEIVLTAITFQPSHFQPRCKKKHRASNKDVKWRQGIKLGNFPPFCNYVSEIYSCDTTSTASRITAYSVHFVVWCRR